MSFGSFMKRLLTGAAKTTATTPTVASDSAARSQVSVGVQAAVEQLQQQREQIRSMRCLIVDDNASNLDLMGKVLRYAGHEPFFASSGQDALALLGQQRIAVAFVDLVMPGLSGWDVLEAIQRDVPADRRPTVILLSADEGGAIDERARASGAYGFLSKPVVVPKLMAALADIAASNPASPG